VTQSAFPRSLPPPWSPSSSSYLLPLPSLLLSLHPPHQPAVSHSADAATSLVSCPYTGGASNTGASFGTLHLSISHSHSSKLWVFQQRVIHHLILSYHNVSFTSLPRGRNIILHGDAIEAHVVSPCRRESKSCDSVDSLWSHSTDDSSLWGIQKTNVFLPRPL
jgi:hypothetical protein